MVVPKRLWWEIIVVGVVTGIVSWFLPALKPVALFQDWLQQQVLNVSPGVLRTVLNWIAEHPASIPAIVGTIVGLAILAKTLVPLRPIGTGAQAESQRILIQTIRDFIFLDHLERLERAKERIDARLQHTDSPVTERLSDDVREWGLELADILQPRYPGDASALRSRFSLGTDRLNRDKLQGDILSADYLTKRMNEVRSKYPCEGR